MPVARVAHFTIVGTLGQGGMGVVYRATDEKLHRTVALKLLPESASEDPRARQRLLREARAAAAVSHPNIATIFEIGEDEGRIFVAMELVDGVTLRKRMSTTGPMGAAEVIAIAIPIAKGLAKAHQKTIVHRDLKPDNVMIDVEGTPKILDFGLAKSHTPASEDDATVSAVTEPGDLVGTPSYMPPEALRGEETDTRADVYAFGVMLYEMLTFMRPFPGPAAIAIAASLRDDPTPPTKHVPTIPADLERLVLRCLAKKQTERYADGRALVDALEALGKEKVDEAVADTVPMEAAPPQREPATKKIGLALLAVIALVVATFALRRAGDPAGGDAGLPSASLGLATLPPPKCADAANAEIRAGREAMRQLGATAAEARFEAAKKIDENCAEALLRLAMVTERHHPSDAREALAKARALGTLSARDAALLHALEPSFAAEPNEPETRRRLRALVTAHPDDAEILAQAAEHAPDDPTYAMDVARRAARIDPGYVDAWQFLAQAAARSGDLAAADGALGQCVLHAPSAMDCLYERALLMRRVGRCGDAEHAAREAIAKNTTASWIRPQLATALASKGAPRELVSEVLVPFWSNLAPTREFEKPLGSALVAVLYGDFAKAREELDALARTISGRQELVQHGAWVLANLELLEETGQTDAARRFAEDQAKRLGAWTRPPRLSRSAWGVRFLEPRLAAMVPAMRAPLLESWRRVAPGSDLDPMAAWAYGDALLADTAADASTAANHLPAHTNRPPNDFPVVDYLAGRTFLLAERSALAEHHLKIATARCDAAEYPFEHVRAFERLGATYEARARTADACAAYAEVMKRWGSTQPPSVTATKAKARRAALACP